MFRKIYQSPFVVFMKERIEGDTPFFIQGEKTGMGWGKKVKENTSLRADMANSFIDAGFSPT